MDPLTFYRTRSVARFQPDHERGVVFLDFAEALPGTKGRPQEGVARYKWDEKITVALSPYEVATLATGCHMVMSGAVEKWSIFHQAPGGPAKSVLLVEPEGESKAAAFLSVKTEDRRIAVPMSTEDLTVLSRLLPMAAAACMGWITSAKPRWKDEGDTWRRYGENGWEGEAPQDDGGQAAEPTEGPEEQVDRGILERDKRWREEATERLTSRADHLRKNNVRGDPPPHILSTVQHKLMEVFAPRKDAASRAGEVIKAIFDVEKSASLDRAQVQAIFEWLVGPMDPDTGDYTINPKAEEQARALAGLP